MQKFQIQVKSIIPFSKGIYEFVELGLKGDLTNAAAEPSFLFVVADMPGVGKIGQVCNGEIAWSYNPGLMSLEDRK